jgi:type II secretory pathway pseudopilin PulG
MIIVAIIGLLAALAIPGYLRARESTENGRFVGDVRIARQAFILHAIERNTYPADETPGVVPTGMNEYLGNFAWAGTPSVGGQWDWDHQVFGFTAGVSVHQPRALASQFLRVDEIVDDGNLATGSFQSRAGGYISVIE